jgi:hypothetical protein
MSLKTGSFTNNFSTNAIGSADGCKLYIAACAVGYERRSTISLLLAVSEIYFRDKRKPLLLVHRLSLCYLAH